VDDTIFYATCNNNSGAIKILRSQIYVAIEWLRQWKIAINPTKTTAIMFSNKQIQAGEYIKFGDAPIKWKTKVRYLGVTIDKNLNFKFHVKNIISKAKFAKYSLFPFINVHSLLTINLKLFIFKTYIRPIITYAGSAWITNISRTS